VDHHTGCQQLVFGLQRDAGKSAANPACCSESTTALARLTFLDSDILIPVLGPDIDITTTPLLLLLPWGFVARVACRCWLTWCVLCWRWRCPLLRDAAADGATTAPMVVLAANIFLPKNFCHKTFAKKLLPKTFAKLLPKRCVAGVGCAGRHSLRDGACLDDVRFAMPTRGGMSGDGYEYEALDVSSKRSLVFLGGFEMLIWVG
jgi:hypothetical protein